MLQFQIQIRTNILGNQVILSDSYSAIAFVVLKAF
jgi:hypothetical protein